MILLVARISPVVPDAAVPTPNEPNCTDDAVLIDWGVDKVTAPVEADAIIWLAVPVIEVTPPLGAVETQVVPLDVIRYR